MLYATTPYAQLNSNGEIHTSSSIYCILSVRLPSLAHIHSTAIQLVWRQRSFCRTLGRHISLIEKKPSDKFVVFPICAQMILDGYCVIFYRITSVKRQVRMNVSGKLKTVLSSFRQHSAPVNDLYEGTYHQSWGLNSSCACILSLVHADMSLGLNSPFWKFEVTIKS